MKTGFWLWKPLVLLGAIGVPVYGQANPSESERRAIVRVVTKWDGGCDGSRRSAWDNMLDAWYDEITDDDPAPDGHGAAKAWVRDGFYKNGNIVDSDFTDPDLVAWGNDDASDRLDEDDVCMVGLHGGESSTGARWYGRVRVDEAGDGNCNAYQGHISLGDTDLEFLHLSSCHSMCDDNWAEWWDSFNGVHQIDGFHGIMYISTLFNDYYRDFGDDVFDDPIAEAWIDNLYDPAHWYEFWQDGDQCPVAYAVGTSEDDVTERIDHEEYDEVYSDPNNPTWYSIVWVGGCDPDNDSALPN